MRSVLIVIFVFFYLLLGLPVPGAMWIIHKFAPAWADMAQLRMVQWAFRVIIFLSGADIEFIGEENVPKDEAVLYIGNHRSFFDIIITYSRCPRLTGYIFNFFRICFCPVDFCDLLLFQATIEFTYINSLPVFGPR